MKKCLWLPLVAIWLAALFGCGPFAFQASEVPKTRIVLNSAELDQFFYDRDIAGYPFTPDEAYAIPVESWVRERFPDAWYQFRGSLLEYQPGSNDCDDFTRGAAFFAQLLHSRNPQRPPGTALSIGEFWFNRPGRDGHAVNAIVCVRDGTTNLVLLFFEPQESKLIELTKAEMEACYARRF